MTVCRSPNKDSILIYMSSALKLSNELFNGLYLRIFIEKNVEDCLPKRFRIPRLGVSSPLELARILSAVLSILTLFGKACCSPTTRSEIIINNIN